MPKRIYFIRRIRIATMAGIGCISIGRASRQGDNRIIAMPSCGTFGIRRISASTTRFICVPTLFGTSRHFFAVRNSIMPQRRDFFRFRRMTNGTSMYLFSYLRAGCLCNGPLAPLMPTGCQHVAHVRMSAC